MIANDALVAAHAAVDACDLMATKLDKQCCDPGRSPQMNRLAETLRLIRSSLGEIVDNPFSADAAIRQIENAGAQIGRLQVSCCTPTRMKLYSGILKELTTAHLAITAGTGTGH